MEKGAMEVVSVSQLLQRSRPLTGTSSLTFTPSISPSKSHKKTQPSDEPSKPSFPPNSTTTSDQNPNPRFLKPLNHPTTLIGILTLPSGATNASSPTQDRCCSNPCCLQFSDDSATVCCDILDLDVQIIDRKIKVLAWNFIPSKSGPGFLEIIRWSLSENIPSASSSSNSISIPLMTGSLVKESSSSRGYCICGLLESVSPISNTPSTSGGSNVGGSRNVCGFLIQILVCECEWCSSKDRGMVPGEMNEEAGHRFAKSKIVYFTGSASSWYTVISRLVGDRVSLSGLKKKLVQIGKEESHIMYSTTEKTSLHLSKDHNSPTRCPKKRNGKLETTGDCCMYSGIITQIYIKGMVVELDQTVLLLLTDHQLCLPHSIRVGAIVSVRNIHFVYPTCSWTKVVILGSCFKTSILVKAFSPMEIGSHQFLPSHSLLGKLINSLAFSARLWVLLVVSSFRKKFAGILSEKEILGSKNTEGLAQKYSSSCLPLSVFRFRHGVFTEYFKHESCGCGNEPIYDLPRLVVPISNFIGYCEEYMQKMQRETNSDILGTDNRYSIISCDGKSYEQPFRRVLKSEDVNAVLLGCLKVSQYSGRLQLVDATGSIDIVIPDLPSNWRITDIFEIKDYNVILEGIHERTSHPVSLVNESFSCKSIFNSFQLAGQRKFEKIYIYCHLRNDESRNCTIYSSTDRKVNFEELESGSFHLLWVTHKFPVLQKFPGNQVVSDKSCIYAEVVILPWNLFLSKKDGATCPPKISCDHRTDPNEPDVSSTCQKHVSRKRCKVDLASTGSLISDFSDAGSDLFGQTNLCSGAGRSYNDEQESCDFSCPYELGCSITYRSMNDQGVTSSATLLHVRKSRMPVNSCFRMGEKVMLEFGPDSFCKYELLRIGGFYMIKHHKEDAICAAIVSNAIIDGKVAINSTTRLWSILFCTNDGVPLEIGQSCFRPNVTNKEVLPEISHPLSFLRITDSYTDMYINLSADSLSFFEADFKTLEDAIIKPSTSLKEEVNSFQCTRASVQSTGNSDCDIHLLVGNFLSIHGQVLAVHKSDRGPLSTQVSHKGSYDVHQRHFSQGGAISSICIHVLVDHNIVKIFSSLSTCAYPIGFGAGVEVTFHRALVLREENHVLFLGQLYGCPEIKTQQFHRQDSLMLTPASFIVINSITVVDTQYSGYCNDMPATSNIDNETSLETLPAALISEATQCLEHKLMHFSCKVVAVYVLMLEKNNEVLHSHPRNCSRLPFGYIPLAGILIDDGSSLCCCWADGENAATLLRLNEGLHHEASRKSLYSSQKRWIGKACNSNIGRMGKIIKRHGRVAVKNYGSVFDSSAQDFTFTVTSDAFVSRSDEEFLKLTILNACVSSIWNVAGTIMDSDAVIHLQKSLAKLDMTMLPLLNIWASKVSHSNPIKEARNIFEELLRHD